MEATPIPSARNGALNFFGAANMFCGAAAQRTSIQTSHGKALPVSLSSHVEASVPSSGGTFTVMGFHWEAMTIAVDVDETGTSAAAATAFARAATLGVHIYEAMASFQPPHIHVPQRGERARTGRSDDGGASLIPYSVDHLARELGGITCHAGADGRLYPFTGAGGTGRCGRG